MMGALNMYLGIAWEFKGILLNRIPSLDIYFFS